MADVRPDDRVVPRRVTLQDVADRAGVSLTTASRVVNDGARRVGKPLADRVNKAAADLGYTANLQARAVATGQSTMIGVALRDISDPYFSSIAAGFIEEKYGSEMSRSATPIIVLCPVATALACRFAV